MGVLLSAAEVVLPLFRTMQLKVPVLSNRPKTPQIAPSCMGPRSPHLTRVLWLTRVDIPNGISICSAVL